MKVKPFWLLLYSVVHVLKTVVHVLKTVVHVLKTGCQSNKHCVLSRKMYIKTIWKQSVIIWCVLVIFLLASYACEIHINLFDNATWTFDLCLYMLQEENSVTFYQNCTAPSHFCMINKETFEHDKSVWQSLC